METRALELFRQDGRCPQCATVLTVCGRRQAGPAATLQYTVSCPVCRSDVTFASPGVADREHVSLICYERPRASA